MGRGAAAGSGGPREPDPTAISASAELPRFVWPPRSAPPAAAVAAAMAQADIALIGLAVMGQNLILNMNDHGFVVCAFNRTVSKVDDFLANEAKGTKVVGAQSLKEMVSKLKKPRRVILLVKAGQAVDDFIEKLVPLLDTGDIIIDGGNSEYRDTTRRCRDLKAKGILFVGSGVSGGEEGARYGPSLMPGGNREAWPHIKTIFQSIAAKVGTGEPCCDWASSGRPCKTMGNVGLSEGWSAQLSRGHLGPGVDFVALASV